MLQNKRFLITIEEEITQDAQPPSSTWRVLNLKTLLAFLQVELKNFKFKIRNTCNEQARRGTRHNGAWKEIGRVELENYAAALWKKRKHLR